MGGLSTALSARKFATVTGLAVGPIALSSELGLARLELKGGGAGLALDGHGKAQYRDCSSCVASGANNALKRQDYSASTVYPSKLGRKSSIGSGHNIASSAARHVVANRADIGSISWCEGIHALRHGQFSNIWHFSFGGIE